MYTLILLGSPRMNGNSETLARAAGESLEAAGGEVEYIHLNFLKIRPCQGCGGCDKTGQCILRDDMDLIYEKLDRADRVIMASPIYFYSVSAQLKIVMDRVQAFWARKYLLKVRFREGEGRCGYFISTAATKGAKLFDCAELPVRYTFDAMGLEYGEPLLVRGVDEKGGVNKGEEHLQRAREYGKQIASGRI